MWLSSALSNKRIRVVNNILIKKYEHSSCPSLDLVAAFKVTKGPVDGVLTVKRGKFGFTWSNLHRVYRGKLERDRIRGGRGIEVGHLLGRGSRRLSPFSIFSEFTQCGQFFIVASALFFWHMPISLVILISMQSRPTCKKCTLLITACKYSATQCCQRKISAFIM